MHGHYMPTSNSQKTAPSILINVVYIVLYINIGNSMAIEKPNKFKSIRKSYFFKS